MFDIDGVLADVRHRLPYIENKPKRWGKFFAEAVKDETHPEGLELLKKLGEDHDVVFLTGRPENCREQTESWLRGLGLEGQVYMRPGGNYRPASETKSEQLDRINALQPVTVVIDDDPRVLDAHAAKGYKTFLATWAPHQETLRRAQEDEGRT